MKTTVTAAILAFCLASGVSSQSIDTAAAKAAFYRAGNSLLETLSVAGERHNTESRAWIGYLWAPRDYAAPSLFSNTKAAPVFDTGAVTESGTIGASSASRRWPHFTAGITLGVVAWDITGINDGIRASGGTASNTDNFLFPVIAADFRLGGIVYPFDIGFSFTALDFSKITDTFGMQNLSLTYDAFAVDFRYLLIAQERFRPNVSAGFGYAHVAIDAAIRSSESNSIGSADVGAAMDAASDSLYLKAHADYTWRNFSVFTDLAFLTSALNVEGGFGTTARGFGVTINASETYKDKTPFFHAVNPVLGAGIAWNLGPVQTVLSASLDLAAGVGAAAYSLRLKI